MELVWGRAVSMGEAAAATTVFDPERVERIVRELTDRCLRDDNIPWLADQVMDVKVRLSSGGTQTVRRQEATSIRKTIERIDARIIQMSASFQTTSNFVDEMAKRLARYERAYDTLHHRVDTAHEYRQDLEAQVHKLEKALRAQVTVSLSLQQHVARLETRLEHMMMASAEEVKMKAILHQRMEQLEQDNKVLKATMKRFLEYHVVPCSLVETQPPSPEYSPPGSPRFSES